MHRCLVRSGYQQCKLCRKLVRADYLQRGSSLGLVPNETGDPQPAKFNTSCFKPLRPQYFLSAVSRFKRIVRLLIWRPQSRGCQPLGDVVGCVGLPCPTLHACTFAATQGKGFGLCSNLVDPFRDPLARWTSSGSREPRFTAGTIATARVALKRWPTIGRGLTGSGTGSRTMSAFRYSIWR
jgi:hypothetical protein